MDIKHLITFLTFARERSYNRAAQKLNYSVSSLVSHISSLEDEFHVELIHSHGRRSVLTSAGEQFLPYAQKIVDLYQEAYVKMTAVQEVSGRLQISVSETVGLYRLSPLYSLFSKQYPQVQLTIRVNSSPSFVQQLLHEETDVVFSQDFTLPQNERIMTVPLYQEPVVLVAPPQHPLARKTVVYPKDLCRQTLLFPRRAYIEHPLLKNILQESGASVDESLFLDSGILLIRAIKDRRCLSFMPLSSVKRELEQTDLVQLPWAGEAVAMMVYAMYDSRSFVLPAIQALITFVQNAVAEP